MDKEEHPSLRPGALPALLLTTTTALRTLVWSSKTGLASRATTHETQVSLKTTATSRCYEYGAIVERLARYSTEA